MKLSQFLLGKGSAWSWLAVKLSVVTEDSGRDAAVSAPESVFASIAAAPICTSAVPRLLAGRLFWDVAASVAAKDLGSAQRAQARIGNAAEVSSFVQFRSIMKTSQQQMEDELTGRERGWEGTLARRFLFPLQ
jgi:hypothetical protein